MPKKSLLLICALILCSFAAACSTSTSGDSENLAPATTETPATTQAPTTTINPEAVENAQQLEEYISQAAAFSQVEAAYLIPSDLNPKAGGAPGYTRYVFRETSAGVVPTLVEGPIGAQTRCDDPALPCSYLDLVELRDSGGDIPTELNMSKDELATLVGQGDTLSAFALLHTDVNTACSNGFVSDQIQTPNMGSHFYNPQYLSLIHI